MTNYRYGADKERWLMKHLESKGYHCTRAGGSFGLFDLVAYNNERCLHIQVKSSHRKYHPSAQLIKSMQHQLPAGCGNVIAYWSEKRWYVLIFSEPNPLQQGGLEIL